MQYKIYTNCRTGWIYEVNAESKEEAEEKFLDGQIDDDYEDLDWEGDSEEEIVAII